jgi:cyclase
MSERGAASPDRARLVEIGPDVYAWIQPDGTWWINNAGAIVADGGVLVVDTCATVRRTQRFLVALRGAVPDAAIRFAVNTHQHGDHTYGNSQLPAETVLIGHERMREGLGVDPIIDRCPPFWDPIPDWGPVERRLPDVAVDSSLAVYLGPRRVESHHPGGPAHTTGDLIVWLPEQRVLFTGDLVFAGLTPLVVMGSVTGALSALDWLRSFGPEVVVPGHGPILTGGEIARVFDEQRRYYRFLLEVAEEGLRAGHSPLETARNVDLGEFADWPDAERLVLNLRRIYADRSGEPLDLMAAFADAVAWRGGPMPTSV